MKLSVILSFLIVASVEVVQAQNAYVKLGQQALMDGDFKQAVSHLEKACVVDSTNANALWMLGYSYYHSENYKKAIATYCKVIEIKPTDCSAYYYRAMAKSYYARDVQTSAADKEKNLLGAILDLSKAININPNDIKFYQNRGIFYREYAAFKLQKANKFYDRTRGLNSLKASVTDLEKVLADNPDRKDISTQLDMSKQQLTVATAAVHN
ncbi:tetratricopeptide repeat protein [Mucilaginibacter gracilis]|uniref:Tetratricopeptide repeat protein n=1 Tax=Mucilaginibacter gracilis TaxID=423350 RepID=A0A495J2L4_9SPHI|nr:tetratricopeptide repeat protein [Mucilaginibacter gracilis]RKR82584.1 tetratricopeptide repeat protein [Mucilaginibacter gracilis]